MVSLSDGKSGYMEKSYIHVPSENTNYTGIAGRVIATGTNLRAEPSTNSDSIDRYVSGETMEIDAETDGFYHVTMKDGKTGYMEADYVYAYSIDTATQSLYHTGVLRSELNLRSDATRESTNMGTYERGTKVQIINEKDGFYHVYLHNGLIGYMEADYIDVEGSTDDSNG